MSNFNSIYYIYRIHILCLTVYKKCFHEDRKKKSSCYNKILFFGKKMIIQTKQIKVKLNAVFDEFSLLFKTIWLHLHDQEWDV